MTVNKKNLLYFLGILTPIGISTKFYNGPGAEWVSGSLSGILFVLFWCLVLRLIFARARNMTLTAGVFLCVCGLEVLQLWHPVFLEALRSTFPGKVLLGTTFSWNDFPYYFIGTWIGYQVLKRMSADPPPESSPRAPAEQQFRTQMDDLH